MSAVVVNISSAVRWRLLAVVVVLGGGGLVLFAEYATGLTAASAAQRVGGTVLSLVLLAFGWFALRSAVRPSLRVEVTADGLRLRGSNADFRVTWPELTRLSLRREHRSWGRTRYWSFRLLLTPKPGLFAMDHPEMARRLIGTEYVYDLGRIGHAGRRLDSALRLHCPALYTGTDTD